MTDREMDAVIAEKVCGWVSGDVRALASTATVKCWAPRSDLLPMNGGWSEHALRENYQPDPYSTDLNAMAEAERAIPERLRGKYASELWRVVEREMPPIALEHLSSNAVDFWHITATAQQRAKAMLAILDLPRGRGEGAGNA